MAKRRESGDDLDQVKEVFFCACGVAEHQFIFTYYRSEPDIAYLQVHLNPDLSFLRRLWLGIKYVLGMNPKGGYEFDDVVLYIWDAHRLSALLRRFTVDNYMSETRSK